MPEDFLAAEAEAIRSAPRWKRYIWALQHHEKPLGFVVALAGYATTPAEEMTFAAAEATPQDGPKASRRLRRSGISVALLHDTEIAISSSPS